ncbi:MAG: GMC family oxidoreductase N-terminal domain-containing protein [Rhodobacter sp.]|nr:GMC family oxidoreductase N-terminal domain-containing protein [Rhodobacter sp.]MCA3457236.1 GMC family oxidoreductase N-terminal domain-containing protein [Rhodobacter sp.]MCA3460258.1 GMC family oxidoreductase N-terminal domain-containing protein [Rhodobacter sp.]MCA3463354.1 GMC family oxidoreductase N-terminal domain-containing protein [Rhodobacter sp.]MCA3466599.1 GMC family oxidoreductase N-terminal domain-containing protein [Rhodobacter sp.]
MQEAEFIIAGGGSAGCVPACLPSDESAVSVLLQEAGERDKSVLFHWQAGFARMTKGIASRGWSTVPQRQMKGRSLWFTRARLIGVGSSMNAQSCARGNRRHHDAWAEECGCKGWSRRGILPCFRRAEADERLADDLHGSDGQPGVSMPRATLPICDAFMGAGQEWGMPYNPDFNDRAQAAVGCCRLTQRCVRRSPTVVAYLRGAETRPNLTVKKGAQVRRIVVKRGRAVGIGMTDSTVHRARHEAILAAGAAGSLRFLLLSGIGPADHLRDAGVTVKHDLPGAGENLQDHIDVCVLGACTGPHSCDGVQRLNRNARTALQYLMLRSGPVAASLFETGGFWHAGPVAAWPDMQSHLGQGSRIKRGIASIDGWGITPDSACMRPRSRGTVRSAFSDPGAAPLINPDCKAEPHDCEMSLRGLEMASEILAQPALKPFLRFRGPPGRHAKDPAAPFDQPRKMAQADHHPVGTCRMGADEMAVVDPQLRFSTVKGLRVCDASIMPGINSSDTHAPTIIIGKKANDLIRGVQPIPAANLPGDQNARRRAVT